MEIIKTNESTSIVAPVGRTSYVENQQSIEPISILKIMSICTVLLLLLGLSGWKCYDLYDAYKEQNNKRYYNLGIDAVMLSIINQTHTKGYISITVGNNSFSLILPQLCERLNNITSDR